jgi:hypothetical protein
MRDARVQVVASRNEPNEGAGRVAALTDGSAHGSTATHPRREGPGFGAYQPEDIFQLRRNCLAHPVRRRPRHPFG